MRSHLHRRNGPATLNNFLLVPWLLWPKNHVWRRLSKAPVPTYSFGRLLRTDSESGNQPRTAAKFEQRIVPTSFRAASPTWDAKAQQGEVEEATAPYRSPMYRHGFGKLLRTDLGRQSEVEEASPVLQPNLNSRPYRHGFGGLLHRDLGRQSSARKGGGNQPCAPYRHGFGSLLRTDLGCHSAARRGGGGNRPRTAAQFEKRTVPTWFGRLLRTDLGRQSSVGETGPCAPYRHGFGRLLRIDLGRQSAARKGGGNQPCAPYRPGFGRLLRTDLGRQSAAS